MKLAYVLFGIVLLILTFAAPAAEKAPTAPDKRPAAAQPEGTAVGEKLDINTATEEQLRELPGVDKVRAKAIMKGRPYRQKDELVEKKILPQGTYDKIKEQIIAKQKN